MIAYGHRSGHTSEKIYVRFRVYASVNEMAGRNDSIAGSLILILM
jgi:hypothetical protein